MNRRTFIATVGTTAFAGCSEISNRSEPVKLGTVEITNRDEDPHTATVTIGANGETVYQETLELEPRNNQFGSKRLDEKIPSEAAEFTFRIESDVQDKHSVTYNEPHPEGCYNLIFAISREATVDIMEGARGTCS